MKATYTIEQELRSWLQNAKSKYSWLQIKMEYNEDRKIFLVSYSPSSEIEKHHEFILESMMFENSMNQKYGIDAPLFTEEEELFKLSTFAEIIMAKSFTQIFSTAIKYYNEQWSGVCMRAGTKPSKNNHPTSDWNNYAFAA